MSALQSSTEGLPPWSSRSFSEVLKNKSHLPFSPKPTTSYRGKPAIHFSDEENQRFSAPFARALIGKFSQGRPPMEILRKSFQTIGFSGSVSLGLMDYRHILIRFGHQEDYIRCWKKGVWLVEGFPMRIIKWHPNFSVDTESPLVPVWINMPHLPIQLYNKEALYSIAKSIGDPLKIDAATESLSRPSQARVCIELNLLKERQDEIYISLGKWSFWQSVEYEFVPLYCSSCYKIGHNKEVCRKDDSGNRQPSVSQKTSAAVAPRMEYRPIVRSEMPALANSSAAVVQQVNDSVPTATSFASTSSADGLLAPTETMVINSSHKQQQPTDQLSSTPMAVDRSVSCPAAQSASKDDAQPLEVAIPPPSKAAATGHFQVSATSLTKSVLKPLGQPLSHKQQPADSSAPMAIEAPSASKAELLPSPLVEHSALPPTVLPATEVAPSGLPVISSIAGVSPIHKTPTSSPKLPFSRSEMEDLFKNFDAFPVYDFEDFHPSCSNTLADPSEEHTTPIVQDASTSTCDVSHSILDIVLAAKTDPSRSATVAYPSKATSRSDTVAHPSKALIPATNVVDAAPLAVLNPEDDYSDFDSDELLKPLVISRGRGKNKKMVHTDRVLRPRKKK